MRRTRRGGSHHQKLVVVRHPGSPGRDVAFVGGIDLGHSLLDPHEAFAAFRRQAQHEGGRSGTRPPGRVLPHQRGHVTSVERLWATPLYRMVYDPDGRPWRDRLRGRL